MMAYRNGAFINIVKSGLDMADQYFPVFGSEGGTTNFMRLKSGMQRTKTRPVEEWYKQGIDMDAKQRGNVRVMMWRGE
jgi:hypothetical protein